MASGTAPENNKYYLGKSSRVKVKVNYKYECIVYGYQRWRNLCPKIHSTGNLIRISNSSLKSSAKKLIFLQIDNKNYITCI